MADLGSLALEWQKAPSIQVSIRPTGIFLINFDPSVNLVTITDQLAQRPVRPADYPGQKLAVQDLARQVQESPERIIPRLVELAQDFCQAESAGISLYEEETGGPGIFRWHHLSGVLARFNGATTPRNFSPCGVCLDQHRPVLMAHPEQVYTWISDANIVVPEVLLVPLQFGEDDPIGTLWVVAPEGRNFDSEDARLLMELSSFASMGLHLLKLDNRKAFNR